MSMDLGSDALLDDAHPRQRQGTDGKAADCNHYELHLIQLGITGSHRG